MSENFEGRTDNLKGKVDTLDLLNMMIFGIHQKAPALEEIFRHNAVAWLGTKAYLIRYEEMVGHLKRLDTKQAELYFAGLFDACGIAMTDDWRKRVEIGAASREGRLSLREARFDHRERGALLCVAAQGKDSDKEGDGKGDARHGVDDSAGAKRFAAVRPPPTTLSVVHSSP